MKETPNVSPAIENKKTAPNHQAINELLKAVDEVNMAFNDLQKVVNQLDEWVDEQRLTKTEVAGSGEEEGTLTKNYYLFDDDGKQVKIFSVTYDNNILPNNWGTVGQIHRITKFESGVINENSHLMKYRVLGVDLKERSHNMRALISEDRYEYHANGVVKKVHHLRRDVGRGPYPWGNTREEIALLNKNEFKRSIARIDTKDNSLMTYGNDQREIEMEYNKEGSLLRKRVWNVDMQSGTRKEVQLPDGEAEETE